MLNRIIIMGRLGADPDLRYTQDGTCAANFRLAVNRDFKNKATGETLVDWIQCVAWRQTGEFVSKYFTKGDMAVVSGRLQMRDWTDTNGNKRTAAEVVADNVYFGESKKKDGNPSYSGGSSYSGGEGSNGFIPATDPVSVQYTPMEDNDGELPF